MRYGYFDDKQKEYVIDRPDTPASWTNYLGDTNYGAIITNNAGGYSFYKSAAQGRFTRLRFNAVPMDQAGRYIYFHDRDSKDFWSASWQPVGKDQKEFKTECRHGTAYTKIISDYKQIQSEVTYFVPRGKAYEVWMTKLTNTGDRIRNLRAFPFVEYACNWNANDDLGNLQYTQYIAKMSVVDGIIDHASNVNMPEMPEDFQQKDQQRHTFFALVGADTSGYDTDRDLFIGNYNGYGNPAVVQQGVCTNSLAEGGNPCGVLQTDIQLQPGETVEFAVVMGIGHAAKEGAEVKSKYKDLSVLNSELEELKTYWHSRLEVMQVETPDAEINSMLNVWSSYNCQITYAWSRAASLVYAGVRDGLGYRDSVQDMLGVMHSIPEEAGQRLELLITGQASTGGAMPVVKPFAHKPGQEKEPASTEYRSDDCLWLFNAIPEYVNETGNFDFYQKVLPYADRGEDTVWRHLRRAIEFNLERSGKHGIPCGLAADWNDCLVLGHEGESVFVAFQLRFGLVKYIEIAEALKLEAQVDWAQEELAKLDENLDKHCWDEDRYVRAFSDKGFRFGAKENEEGNLFMNPQVWSVISGHADTEKAKTVMNQVHDNLYTDYGIMLCAPPFEKSDFDIVRAVLFNPGMKENAGIFNHTQGWGVIAESILGNGERAYKYYKSYLPATYNEMAEVREIEPYVYAQSTHSKYSKRFGSSRLPWLSGTATWAYYAATQYLLGIRPDVDGLVVDPCIPKDWDGFKVTRKFRGATYIITVCNPDQVMKGVASITVNGQKVKGNKLPVGLPDEVYTVAVIMG
ncbi:N,N'-diacetylchitobiose phosphorylase [Puteibacter caeruleilacunae]|nr:N,N'-diacetylchitobiose phosphorylase [Puteibacter caeruleilacunae]